MNELRRRGRHVLRRLAAASAFVERGAARYRAARVATAANVWRAFQRMPWFARHRISVAVSDVLTLSDGGRKDVLLVTDSRSRLPPLAAIAARLNATRAFSGAVAVVAPDRAAEAALRESAEGVPIVNMQRFWLQADVDLANHEAAERALAVLRSARRSPPAAGRLEMLEAVTMDLHTEMIQIRRLSGALAEARAGGARVIVIGQELGRLWQCIAYEVFARADRPLVALGAPSLGGRERCRVLDLTFDPASDLEGALARGAEREDARGTDSSLVTPPPSGDAIGLVTDAAPGSHFWPAVANVAHAARRDGRPIRALVSRASAAAALSELGVPADVAEVPPEGDPTTADFAVARRELLEVCARALDGRGLGEDPLARQLVRYFTARVAEPGAVAAAYRHEAELRRWIERHGLARLVVLPHWSRLGWAAMGAARALGRPTASAPAVSVAGHRASIVGWERLDLVGCYGTQCRDAFLALGHRPDGLSLCGHVSLDHALAMGRDEARARVPALRAMAGGGRRIVLFATSGANPDERQILQALVPLARDVSARVAIAVRPHPSIGAGFYREVLGGVSSTLAAVVTEGAAAEAIAAADAVVTDFSTMGADAVLLGRPLLVVNTTGAPFSANNYAALGVAAQADAADQAGPLLRRLLDEGPFWPNAAASLASFTSSYNWGGDGQAGRRFLEALLNLPVPATVGSTEAPRARP